MSESELDSKRCSKCGEAKPKADFNRSQGNVDGLKGVCRACQGTYYQANREREKTRSVARYAANHERLAAEAAAYRVAHPDVMRGIAHNRRARLRGAPTFGRVSFQEVRERDRDVCWLCGKPVDDRTRSYDHAIPLAKGGEHSTRNIRVAHRRCNSVKRTKLVTHQRFLF